MKNIGYYRAPIFWMVLIFLLSTRQRLAVSEEYVYNFLFFKTLHVIEYAILFILLVRSIRMHQPGLATRQILCRSAIVSILYAMSDEIHQMFVPTREGHLRDVIIDAVGVGVAWIFLIQLQLKAPERLRKLARDLRVL